MHFTKDRLYCQSCGILNALYNLRFLQETILLRPELVLTSSGRNNVLVQQYKGIVFHHSKAKPHTSLVTCQKTLKLGCDVLLHPPYLSDLALSDYYLFISLQNDLNGKTNTIDDVKPYLELFFGDNVKRIYERGIMKLH